jgi:hypothetical protein
MTPVSTLEVRVNLGRVAAGHCFPGHKNVELRADPTWQSQVLAQSVRGPEWIGGETAQMPAQDLLWRSDPAE